MRSFWIVILILVLAAGATFYYTCNHRGLLRNENLAQRTPFQALLDKRNTLTGWNLTSDQQNKLKLIVTELQDKRLALKLEEEKKRIEIAQMILTSTPDKGALSAKLEEMLAVKRKEQQTMLAAYFQINALLTPDQKHSFSRFIIQRLMSHGAERWQQPTPLQH